MTPGADAMPERAIYRTTGDLLYRFGLLRRAAEEWLRAMRPTRRPSIHLFQPSLPGGGHPPRGRVAFFPGSFDPPTRAHAALVRSLLRPGRFRRVLLIFDLDNVDKAGHAAPLADRIALACIAFRREPRVEMAVATHGRFLEKAAAIRRAGLAERRIPFVVGADTYSRVLAPRFYKRPEAEIPRLLEQALLVVFPRDGAAPVPEGSPGVERLPLRPAYRRISSTAIREAIRRGAWPTVEASAEVLLSVQSAGLYRRRARPESTVVTSFLMKRGRVLILKRSEEVGSFQASWAGVSGYLEWPLHRTEELLRDRIPLHEHRAQALRQVYREIREETGLRRRDVKFVRRRAAGRFRDAKGGRTWVVHPFLFEVREGASIHLDWEHDEARWVWPEGLRSYPIVPGLDRALASVLPNRRRRRREARSFAERAAAIAIDPRGGARQLYRAALDLLDELAALGAEGGEAFAREMMEVGTALASRHPMAPLRNLSEMCLRVASHPPGPSKRGLSHILVRLRRRDDAAARSVGRRAATALGRLATVATYSFSSTVLDALALARRRPRTVRVVRDESGHSRRLARALRAAGVTGVEMADEPGDADALLLGCDAVYGRAAFLNARGSRRLVEEARRAHVPVLVLTHPMKRRPGPAPRQGDDPGFEVVPARGVTFL